MFELPPKRKRGRSPSGVDSTPRPPGVHKRGKRIVSLLQTLQRQDETVADAADGAGVGGAGQPNLLGVPGLTRQALDVCVSSFFGSTGHIVRLSQPQELLARRVRVMLYETAGLEVPKDLTGVDAASELLALAVAALGAPSSPYPHLRAPLLERCLELASDAEYLSKGGLDEVEAINLLSNLKRPLPRTSRALLSNPLALDPLGRGYPVELAIYHNVNIRPVQGDHVLDYNRREVLFWIIWASDAVRSACIGAQPALAETDVGWPWHQSNADDGAMPLARVARHVGSTMLSMRARCTGLHNDNVRVAVNELDVLAHDTADLAWLRAQGASREPSSGIPAAMALFAARNLLYVVCWAAAKCDAAQHPRNLSSRILDMVESAALRATENMLCLASTIRESKLLSAPTVVSTRFVSFAVFLLYLLVENAQKQQRVEQSSPELSAHAEAIIAIVEVMDCYDDTAGVVAALRTALGRVNATDRAPDTATIHELIAKLEAHDIGTPFSAFDI